VSTLLHDLRSGLRSLRQSPAFTAIVVLTIGLGIGANATVFSWIRPLLLNPLPGTADSSRLVALENFANTGHGNGEPLTTSYLDFRDYRDHLQLLDVIASGYGSFAAGDERRSETVWCELVSGNFFGILGVRPEVGRFFTPAEQGDTQNRQPVAIISHSYWRSHFNGSMSAIGSTLRLNRVAFTIIGVAPEAFHGTQTGLDFQIWAPLTMYGAVTHTGTWMLNDRSTRNFMLLARLKPGVTQAQAGAEATALATRMADANVPDDTGIGLAVLRVAQSHFRPQAILLKPIEILMGASGVLLLTVCANVANLLLARATGRQQEFFVRLALGASPGQLARQLLTESLLLAGAGSGVGLLLAGWLGNALRWLLPAVSGPPTLQPKLSGALIGFTVLLAAAAALLAGVAPAWHAARANVSEMLKDGGRSGAAGVKSHHLRRLLVVAEVALAVIALVGAGTFLKSFQAARALAPGFTPEGQALAQFNLSTAGYTQTQADAFYQGLTERLKADPGITAVSYADTVPLGFYPGNWEPLQIDGYQPEPNENMKIYRNLIGPGYFAVMKIPLLAGRDFNLRDDAKSPGVMIVSEGFVHRFSPGRDPIGRKVHGWGKWFTIVGVVQDIKIHHVSESTVPFFYIPIRQVYRPEYGVTFHIRTSGPVAAALVAARREAAAFDPALTLFDAQAMTDYVAESLFGQKIAASILSLLGILSLGLAAMGLYSVMAYSVGQRTGEIGIRVALGAQPFQVWTLILRQGMGFAAIGLVVGIFAAAGLVRTMSATFTLVHPADPGVYFVAAGFTLSIAFAAVSVPARKALRVDPVVALRSQ
jgi:putative ABC transport system permease protein